MPKKKQTGSFEMSVKSTVICFILHLHNQASESNNCIIARFEVAVTALVTNATDCLVGVTNTKQQNAMFIFAIQSQHFYAKNHSSEMLNSDQYLTIVAIFS